MYLSDRQRVEIGLPSHMMLAALIAGVEDQGSDEFKKAKADLIEAGGEPVADLQDRKAVSVLNRTRSVLDAITKDHIKEGAEVSKVALITFHFMRFIIEDGYLQYTADGAFDRSINAFMEALEYKAQEPLVNASAIKQAKKMLRQLQDMGYYRDVNPPD